MKKSDIKKYCDLERPEDVNDSIHVPKGNIVMTYNDEEVIDVDFRCNVITTIEGIEHFNTYDLLSSDWKKVRVFKEIK